MDGSEYRRSTIRTEVNDMTTFFGVDVGGSGIKGASIDSAQGELVSERYRVKTPQPATPEAVVEAISGLVAHCEWDGPIGVTIPGVVQAGVVATAANIGSRIAVEINTCSAHGSSSENSVVAYAPNALAYKPIVTK